MLSKIFPKSYKKYLSLPVFGPHMDEFTRWSYEHGYTLKTIRCQIKHTNQIVTFFQNEDLHLSESLTHMDFDKAYQYFRHDRPAIAGTIRQFEMFLDQSQGLPLPMLPHKTHTDWELERFTGYLKSVRGLNDTTIQYHSKYIKRFLDHIVFEKKGSSLSNLTLGLIDGFIEKCSKTNNRYSLQHIIGYLRSFLRYQHSMGVLQTPLYEMIDTPRVYRPEKLPRSFPWSIVNKLLLSIDKTDPLNTIPCLFLSQSMACVPAKSYLWL